MKRTGDSRQVFRSPRLSDHFESFDLLKTRCSQNATLAAGIATRRLLDKDYCCRIPIHAFLIS